MSLPAGPFPGGYSVNQGSPVENWTSTGSEVSVEYVGDSDQRVTFLENMFGSWSMLEEKLCPSNPLSERACSAELLAEPKSYPYPTVIQNGFCTGEACLWPDSFSCKPAGGDVPALASCPTPPPPDDVVPEAWQRPIFGRCPASITINYRHKAMGKVPDIFGACYRTPVGIPIIPYGTYLEVRSRYDDVVIEHPGRAWSYTVETVNPEGDWLGTPEEISAKEKSLQLPRDIGVFETINSQRIELIWDYVPNPPWGILSQANGTLNALPFLGFPAESVRFTMGEPEIRGGFGCGDFYRLRMNFDVRTTQVDCDLPVETVFDGDEYVFGKGFMVGGSIGIWNRRFSKLPMSLRFGFGCKTHWVPVTDGDQGLREQPPFRTFPFEWLFAMNLVCPNVLGPDSVKFYNPSTQQVEEFFCDATATDPLLDRYGEVRVAWRNGLNGITRAYLPMVSKTTATMLQTYMNTSIPYDQHSSLSSISFTPYGDTYCD